MIAILLVAPEKESFAQLKGALEADNDLEIYCADCGAKAMAMAGEVACDLVVADEGLGDMTALEFAENLTRLNPMINCAVVSSLPPAEFHEASEGLGILFQLPPRPGADAAGEMLRRLKEVLGMARAVSKA